MKPSFTITSTSKNSATGEDITLRETTITRLIFRPELVNNPNNPEASVKGTFIFQRKKNKGNWADYKTLDLRKLRDGEWIKLELHSTELKELILYLDQYYQIFEQYGIRSGKTDYIVTPQNAKSILANFLKNPENFSKLQEMSTKDLTQLRIISTTNSLKKVLNTWEINKGNSDEEFWQVFFKENSWIISQVFSCPVVLFKDKAYVGGKTIDNKGGNIIDLLFKNKFTDNVLLVEIKSPVTKILGNEYRQGAYGWSYEMSGAISQVLKYKNEIYQNYLSLVGENDSLFHVFDPRCMLVAGNSMNEITNNSSRRSFSLLRNDSKNIQIITFNELFEKVTLLIKLLEKH